MRLKLTKKIVEGLPTSDKDLLTWDSEVPGFGIKVTPKGKRIYFAYYRAASGQQRRPKIGEHGVLTVDQARQIARQWMAQAATGADISKERQDSRDAGTVAALAARYLKEYAASHKKPRSVQTDSANIENHVLPLIGTMRVRDVTRQDIDGVKVSIRDGKTARTLTAKKRGRRIVRGGAGIANRVVALVSKMFACAQEWGLRDDNPATGVRKYRETRKDRFLDASEVARLLEQLAVAQAQQTASLKAVVAIRVLLFTGMRYSEVMNLTWGAVDDHQMCFRLADSKTGSRIIPYGGHVHSALRLLDRGDAADLVFEGEKSKSPLSLRRPWYKIRTAARIDATATLHTLRHTFASWSVMGGLSLAQVGSLLGHKSTQTTLRYADHAIDAMRAYSEQTGNALAAMTTSRPTETT